MVPSTINLTIIVLSSGTDRRKTMLENAPMSVTPGIPAVVAESNTPTVTIK